MYTCIGVENFTKYMGLKKVSYLIPMYTYKEIENYSKYYKGIENFIE